MLKILTCCYIIYMRNISYEFWPKRQDEISNYLLERIKNSPHFSEQTIGSIELPSDFLMLSMMILLRYQIRMYKSKQSQYYLRSTMKIKIICYLWNCNDKYIYISLKIVV